MSEENAAVEAEVEVTNAEAPAAEATAEKPAKAKKEPRAEEALYCTDKANSEGTVHAQIQKFVFENPGATRSAVVSALAGKIDTKNAQSTEKYVSSYIAGGLRRGYLTHKQAEAVTEFPVKLRKTEKKSEKVAKGELTKQGRNLLETILAVVTGAEAERSTVVSAGTLTEKLGNKPMSHIARTVSKLEKDGFITVVKNDEGAIEGIALTDKEIPAAAAPAEVEAPAAEETAV